MKLSRIIIFSADVTTLSQWYRKVFGLKLREESEGWADLGGIALHGGGCRRTDDCGHKIVFGVRDVKKARARLVARGAKLGPLRRFGKLQLCDGRDPEGNVFQISNRA